VTLWLTPSLPHVSFGDTVANLLPSLEYHILFEWSITISSIKATLIQGVF